MKTRNQTPPGGMWLLPRDKRQTDVGCFQVQTRHTQTITRARHFMWVQQQQQQVVAAPLRWTEMTPEGNSISGTSKWFVSKLPFGCYLWVNNKLILMGLWGNTTQTGKLTRVTNEMLSFVKTFTSSWILSSKIQNDFSSTKTQFTIFTILVTWRWNQDKVWIWNPLPVDQWCAGKCMADETLDAFKSDLQTCEPNMKTIRCCALWQITVPLQETLSPLTVYDNWKECPPPMFYFGSIPAVSK